MKNDNIGSIIEQLRKIRIGVYYVTALWASDLFEKIVAYFGMEQINRYSNNPYNKWIEFKNGDYIRFVCANDSSRGNKFDKVILQSGISFEVFNTLIQPALLSSSYRPAALVINENDEIQDARHYYMEQEEEEKDYGAGIL